VTRLRNCLSFAGFGRQVWSCIERATTGRGRAKYTQFPCARVSCSPGSAADEFGGLPNGGTFYLVDCAAGAARPAHPVRPPSSTHARRDPFPSCVTSAHAEHTRARMTAPSYITTLTPTDAAYTLNPPGPALLTACMPGSVAGLLLYPLFKLDTMNAAIFGVGTSGRIDLARTVCDACGRRA